MRLKFWRKEAQHLPEWFPTSVYGFADDVLSAYAFKVLNGQPHALTGNPPEQQQVD